MDIVINDANVLIDLCHVCLLDEFFRLPFEFHTIDLVIHELKDEKQKQSIQSYVTNGCLQVKRFSSEEHLKATRFAQNLTGNLSLTDAEVIYYALQVPDCRILSGDRQLRNRAEEHHLKVCGIIYVFDQLVELHILSKSIAATRLRELQKSNPRLPSQQIKDRIKDWEK